MLLSLHLPFPRLAFRGEAPGDIRSQALGKAVVFKLWVEIPLGRAAFSQRLVETVGKHKIFTLQLKTVGQLQLWSSNGNNFMVREGQHDMRSCIKGPKSQEGGEPRL